MNRTSVPSSNRLSRVISLIGYRCSSLTLWDYYLPRILRLHISLNLYRNKIGSSLKVIKGRHWEYECGIPTQQRYIHSTLRFHFSITSKTPRSCLRCRSSSSGQARRVACSHIADNAYPWAPTERILYREMCISNVLLYHYRA